MLDDQLTAGGLGDFSANFQSDVLFKKVRLDLTVLGANQSFVGDSSEGLSLVEVRQLN